MLPSTQRLSLPGEKRRDDETILLRLAVDHYEIFSWFDLLHCKQLAPIPDENRCRIDDSIHNLPL